MLSFLCKNVQTSGVCVVMGNKSVNEAYNALNVTSSPED